MPMEESSWPLVGRTSLNHEEHSRHILEEARELLDFGAPSDESSFGKQCPYHTLNAFCASVIAFLETTEGPSKEQTEHNNSGATEQSLETPIKTGPTHDLQYESPYTYKTSRRSSQPLTPYQDKKIHNMMQSREKSLPPHTDTYGVLVLYVPTNFDVDNQGRAIRGIESVNKGYIPGISIKSVEWLIPDWTKTKHYSSLLVEFEFPQHANAAIREQLLVGSKVLSCEYYERDSRLRQCFFCQQYKHQDTQCTATDPVCGRCAGRHVTPTCKVREDAQNFHCVNCRGKHRAWDNACKFRQEELDRVRNARAHAPTYHKENGIVPNDEGSPKKDTPSREFAGTLRYSIDFLLEVNLRDGRRSQGRSRGQGAHNTVLSAPVRDNVLLQQLNTPMAARHKAEHDVLGPVSSSKPIGTPSSSDPFKSWFRSRLLTLGIEPCTPGAPRQSQETDDAEMTPATPTPALRKTSTWKITGRGEDLGKVSDRTRQSLEAGTKQVEKSPSERAANFAKIRASDSWR